MIYTRKFLLEKTTLIKEKFISNSTWPKLAKWFIITISVIFPSHFSNIGIMSFKLKSGKLKSGLRPLFDNFESKQREIKYQKEQIKETERGIIEMSKLRNGNGIIETVFEHLPSSVVIIGLLILSYKYGTLKRFLNQSFLKQFSTNYKIIIGLVVVKTAFSCISSVLNIR